MTFLLHATGVMHCVSELTAINLKTINICRLGVHRGTVRRDTCFGHLSLRVNLKTNLPGKVKSVVAEEPLGMKIYLTNH